MSKPITVHLTMHLPTRCIDCPFASESSMGHGGRDPGLCQLLKEKVEAGEYRSYYDISVPEHTILDDCPLKVSPTGEIHLTYEPSTYRYIYRVKS